MTIAAFYIFIWPLYIGSRVTFYFATTKLAARVVGILNPYRSYDAKNYLKAELTTLFPSACLENGVLPLPFS